MEENIHCTRAGTFVYPTPMPTYGQHLQQCPYQHHKWENQATYIQNHRSCCVLEWLSSNSVVSANLIGEKSSEHNTGGQPGPQQANNKAP